MSINTKEFKTACKRVKGFISNKPRLPILHRVLMTSDGSRLVMTGYNMEVGIGARIGIACDSEPFATTIAFQDMEKIVAKLKADSLEIVPITKPDVRANGDVSETVEYIDVSIKSGPLSFTLNGRDAADYPVLPSPINPADGSDLLAITSAPFATFASELSFVMMATCLDTPKNFTSGVLFNYRADCVHLVGTDGKRLHRAFLPGESVATKPEPIPYLERKPACVDSDNYSAILSSLSLASLIKLPGIADTDTIEIHMHENLMTWSIPACDLSGVTHLLDTPYPDYEKVIPDLSNVFELESKPTLQAIDSLSVIAHERDGRDMVVVNANGRLNLSVKAESMGSANADLPITHIASGIGNNGDDCRFALNIGYLADVMKADTSGTLTMSNAGALEPARFDYQDGRIAIIMPVRLPE